MRVMVTGGAGFIGSAVVRHLVGERGAEVLTIDKLTYAGTMASLRDVADLAGHRFARTDICDRPAMDALLADFRPDCILHLAAESHVDRSITGAAAFMETNVIGTFTLLEAARAYWERLDPARAGAFRFVNVSTDEVYGSLGPHDGRFTEETRYDPSSPYAASKAASDHLVMAWWRTYGLPVMVTNCTNNYGPRQFPEKLIPLTILNALEGRALPVYGDGRHMRDWLHVDDHARALDLVARRGVPGERYVIGAAGERANIDVVDGVCRALDRLRPPGAPHRRLVTHVPDRPGHDRRYAVDPAKLERTLGWSPLVDFETGLERTVAWYAENEWWWRPLRETVYGGDRLGLRAAG